MSSDDRKESQNDFIYDRSQVIVATNAFGMGIDKSNVRFVIHYNMPQSMENYYQEAGRAGRDGESAKCILLFAAQDIMINKFLIEHKEFSDIPEEDAALIQQRDARRLRLMEGYCKTSGCLRNYILEYFGEKNAKPCGSCGNCNKAGPQIDMTEDAKQVINCVYEARGRYGIGVVLGTLLGAGRARLRELGTTKYQTYGALKGRSKSDLRQLLNQLLADGYLYQTEDPYRVLRIGNIQALRDPDTRIMVRVPQKNPIREQVNGPSGKTSNRLTKAGYELLDLLRQLRLTIAREEGMPPYIIFSDKTLIEMSAMAPQDKTAMLRVSGVGEAKFDKYGERFTQAIADFLKAHPDSSTSMEETTSNSAGTSSARVDYNRRMNRPDGAGAAWTEEEDQQLEEEFHAGKSISEMASSHDRTKGGILSRLRKHGLIE